MSHTKQTPSAGANYTVTRRIRPTPQAGINSGLVPAASLSPVGAGTTTGLVPGGPALRVFGPASSQAASSQRRPPAHLPSVKTPETKVQRMNAKQVPEAHIIVRPSEHPVGGGLSDSTPATHRPQRPRGRVLRLWKIVNVVAGYVVFGLPALLAIPALIATAAKFGLWPTITQAGPPALLASLPLLVWVWYTRRPPSTRSRRFAWIVLATLATATLLATPLVFWTAPAFAVLTSELLRALAPQPASSSAPKAPR